MPGAGTRNDRTHDVIGTYVDGITAWPSQKRGEMRLNPAAAPLWKRRDRPKGRSRANPIGATAVDSNPRPGEGQILAANHAVAYGDSLAFLFRWGPPGVEDAGTKRLVAANRSGGGRRAIHNHPGKAPADSQWPAHDATGP
jgi:hypothetical protein